jgi:prepilin-type N-terminal cleavage/methylation domain-containing protein
MHRNGRVRRAFTLIELLVVVAIIALLISILLPALSRARERGRITVCQANLRHIAMAANAYLLEFDDLPWALPGGTGASSGYHAGGREWSWNTPTPFIWGGAMPDKTAADWIATGYSTYVNPVDRADVYSLPPRHRPMNPFLVPTVSWDNGDRDETPARTKRPANTPNFFKCPSDQTALVPDYRAAGNISSLDGIAQSWDFWGSSYPMNWYWANYYTDPGSGRHAEEGRTAGYQGDLLAVLGARPAVRGLGRKMLNRNRAGGWDSRFMLFYENRLNEAMIRARPAGLFNDPPLQVRGWHGEINRHTAGYLDGHAVYVPYDPRFVRGTGWTAWPNTPWRDDWRQFNFTAPPP